MHTTLHRMSRKNKLLWMVFAAIIFVIIYFIVYSHQLLLANSKQEILKKLEGTAATATLLISANQHQKIVERFPNQDDITHIVQDKDYLEIQQILLQVKNKNNLASDVYTLVYNSRKMAFEFIVSSAPHPYFRHTYAVYPQQLKQNYAVGGALKEYKSENGSWLSAFAPIKDKDGLVVGVVQVDESIESVIQAANAVLINNILIALAVIVPFIILFFKYMNNTLLLEEAHTNSLYEANEELKVQSETIRQNNIRLEQAQLTIESKNQQLDSKVRERTSELLKTTKELKAFLYRSSHDIQGPLATLKGLTLLLKKDLEGTPQEVFMDMFNKEVASLSNRIKGVCSVYELKNMRQPVLGTMQLKGALSEVRKKIELERNGPIINWHMEELEGMLVSSNQAVVEIVLEELFRSSLQSRNNFEGAEAIDFYVGCKKKGQSTLLVIKDATKGISTDLLNYYKARFNQNDLSLNANGVGMYAVRLGLKKINARIELNTSEKKHTEFVLEFPA